MPCKRNNLLRLRYDPFWSWYHRDCGVHVSEPRWMTWHWYLHDRTWCGICIINESVSSFWLIIISPRVRIGSSRRTSSRGVSWRFTPWCPITSWRFSGTRIENQCWRHAFHAVPQSSVNAVAPSVCPRSVKNQDLNSCTEIKSVQLQLLPVLWAESADTDFLEKIWA